MEPAADEKEDLTSNIAEAELDRPGYLATTADCVKWAADGRIAVNVGLMALVYQPRFEGRDRYDFTAYSVACPEVDRTILDLQRFPGKAGDAAEFARKGLKYLAADDPDHLEKCSVGGDSNTISALAWSPRGCAWDGGCLLCVVSCLHAVTIFQPPRDSPDGMEWEPLATVSSALLHWGLRVCPTDGAATYREALNLDDDDSGGGGSGGDGGFALSGLWAVARATRTRAVAWMDRRLSLKADSGGGGGGVDVGPDGGGASTLLAMAGEFVITLWTFSSETTPTGEEEGEEEEGGRSLGLVRERPAWAGDLRSMGAGGGDGNIRALAWCHESVSTSPSGGYDNGAAACSSPPRPTRDFLAIGTSAGAVLVLAVDIGTNTDAMAAAAAEPAVSPVHVDAGGGGSSAPARVRSGGITTAVTAVPLRRVCVSDGSPVTFLTFVVPGGTRCGFGSSEQGDSFDSPSSSPRAALAVAKGAMVSLFPLVTATATNGHDREDSQPPATGQAATARVEAGTTTTTALAASGSARGSTPSRRHRFAATPDGQQPAAVTWRAHDHNVTGISTFPFAAPVLSTAPPPSLAGASRSSSTTAPSGRDASATAVGNGKRRQGGEGGGGGGSASGAAASGGGTVAGSGDSSRGVGAERARVGGKRRRREEGDSGGGCRRSDGRATALVYTCSMDGSCREWEVEVAVSPGWDDGGGGREGAAKARLRKTVSRLPKRGQQSPLKTPPPLLGCSVSPNGVLVAFLEFCRPERSTRKAVQNTARKGTHCRVVLTPMMPPATERAATATGGQYSSWNFPLSPGVLLTDWAWYLRAAILGDAAVLSTRKDMSSFSLIPTVRNALEDAILKAAEAARQGAPTGATRSRPRLKSTKEAAAAAVADEEVADNDLPRDSNGGGSSNVGGSFGGTTASSSSSSSSGGGGSSRTPALLWSLLRLHHVYLATAASVAGCQASVHVPPVADNGDGPGDTDEDEYGDGDDDGGGGGDDNSSCGGNGGGDDGAAAADTASDSSELTGGSSRDGKRGEDEEEEEDDEEEPAGSLDATSSRKAAPTRKPGMPPPPAPQQQQQPRQSSSKKAPQPKNTNRFAGNCPAPSPRPRRYRNESELDKKSAASMATVKRNKRRKIAADRVSAADLAARASAAASAARTRLALMRAWEQVPLLPGDVGSGVGRATPAEAPKDAVSATTAVVNGGGGGSGVDEEGRTAAGTNVVQQRQPAAAAKQRAAAERCLRAACWLARARSRSARGRAGGTAGGFLAGPLVTPIIDLPPERDVRAALLQAEGSEKMHYNGRERGRDDDSRGRVEGAAGHAAAPAPLSSSAGPHSSAGEETCLLCGAPILSDAAAAAAAAATAAACAGAYADGPPARGTSSIVSTPVGTGGSPAGGGGGGGGGGGHGKVGSRTTGEENVVKREYTGGGGEDAVVAGELELPGWVVCRRGHRFRRSMDTLAPIPGVGYRRCEVCKCVRALSPSRCDEEHGLGGVASGGSRSDLALPSDGSTCVFCNVMLASCGSAVSWRA